MANILIVDDDTRMAGMLSAYIEELGHSTKCVYTCKDALLAAVSGEFDIVLLDVRLPDGNGLDLIPDLRTVKSAPEIIILTGAGDPEGAELAIRNGAWHYLPKSASLDALKLELLRVLQFREGRLRVSPVVLDAEGVVGRSPALRDCLRLVAQAAATDANVLVVGETGTGKELLARAIHENSSRSGNNFAVVDCTTLPASLVESTLFGHEKGAFTGADRTKEGLIKHADGGTLFLDEVGELPMEVQKSFLRVLQDRRFRLVGAQKEQESDFRLVAATNRDLNAMASEGAFREDLLFRLRSFEIELPPLRDRRGDIKDLTLFYVSKVCERYGVEIKGICPEFLEAMDSYEWPGNVRELVSAVEMAVGAARDEPTLYPRHLPQHMRIRLARNSMENMPAPARQPAPAPNVTIDGTGIPTLEDFRARVLADAESHYLAELMSRTDGDVKQAMEAAGLSRSRFYALLAKYDIKY